MAPVTRSRELRPGYRISSYGRGYCWTTSFANPSLYRCLHGNRIQDPCWSYRTGAAVLCLAQPWQHRLLRLTLTKPLPDNSTGRGGVWGLTMMSGVNCQSSSGAHERFHGHVVSYYCSRRWVLLGHPDRRPSRWQMLTARRVGGQYRIRGTRGLRAAWIPRDPR